MYRSSMFENQNMFQLSDIDVILKYFNNNHKMLNLHVQNNVLFWAKFDMKNMIFIYTKDFSWKKWPKFVKFLK